MEIEVLESPVNPRTLSPREVSDDDYLSQEDTVSSAVAGGVVLGTEVVKTLIVEGYTVPYLTVCEYEDNPEMVSIVVDRRLAYDIPRSSLATVARLAANAMAVAAGRTSFGDNSNVKNLFGDALAGYPTERILGEPVNA